MAHWMWYPGDYEIYQGMKQNFDREERGFMWPAYWYIAQCRQHVAFYARYRIEQETAFRVTAKGSGHVVVKCGEFNRKYPFGTWIPCPVGEVWIDIVVGNMTGLPCAYVEGDVVFSGKGWNVGDFTASEASHVAVREKAPGVPVGCNGMYVRPDQDPQEFEYTEEILVPITAEEADGGILYDFGREITAETIVEFGVNTAEGEKASFEAQGEKRPERLTLCYGESRVEALDTEWCYLKQVLDIPTEDRILELLGRGQGRDEFGAWESTSRYHTRLRAFRYLFIPEKEAAQAVFLKAIYKYVDFPKRSRFVCEDERINQIWNVSETTLRLASGVFFLDGIKRDRWIWSGDAYQSYFLNRYSFFDKEIMKRTMLALRGNDPIVEHINTIVDYSMYWINSIEDYYEMTGDLEFVRMLYPKMESMMHYLLAQTEEHGFLYAREGDWIYIDWANMDKDGMLCAEQLLLARSLQAFAMVRGLLGLEASDYLEKKERLLRNIRQFFWDEEKGAFIDTFESGRRNVTRHANIFAVIFGYATEAERESIRKNVLMNDAVEAITTPYFKFYELEALAQLGCMDTVMEVIRSYWGGMLDKGATTFWEEYKPHETEAAQYGMYGDKFGKSLCHAWGASPMYVIGRYFCGVRPTSAGYATFEVKPETGLFACADCEFPVNEGSVKLAWGDGVLTVQASREGGTLNVGEKEYELPGGTAVRVRL